jgi:predicted transposase/invertase (TIGR01784 family)
MVGIKGYKFKTLHDLELDNEYVLKLSRNIKKGQKISILSDTMLKAMFQNENRIKYSAKFLSYFIDVEYEDILNNICLAKNELDKNNENDKGERCDYVALLSDTSLNIEVNNNSSLEVLERNMEYAHRLYSKKIRRGEENYQYTQVIQFNLNNFAFKGNDKIVDIYTVTNDDNIGLSNKLIFVQIYVPNLRKKWYTKGMKSLSEEEKYILALVEMDLDKLNDLGGENIMDEYVKEAEEVSFEGGVGEAYDKEWALRDQGYRDGLSQGKAEGKIEGFSQGKIENKKEIAKNMLNEGIDINIIIKCTGLTNEDINALK